MVGHRKYSFIFEFSNSGGRGRYVEDVQEIGLWETSNIISQYMTTHGPLPIASPAEHRHQEVYEKMWERHEDLDSRLGKRKVGRSREEKTLVSFKELDRAAVTHVEEGESG